MNFNIYDLTSDGLGFPLPGSSPVPSDGAVATPGSSSGAPSLATQLVEEMVAAWRRGERTAAEAFLERNPELSAESALRLIHEEVCLYQEAGLEVVPADVVSRFPKWRAELELLLDCQRLMQSKRGAASFPEVGELLSGFRLVAELGRGASGRIFLALQNSLAARPVVLKVTTCGQDEHLTLARLQHMNIVPLYSEEVLPSRSQRILCMPYLGGATLARLLELLRNCPPPERSGKRLIEALDQAQEALPVTVPNQGPYRGMLARTPYVQAVAWIGACLADGLQYAHDRGLVHMDVKPSNVLLTGDGQPMLLDFHLARGTIDAAGPLPPGLGGTAGYISPEQKAAMDSIRQGLPIGVAVDGRSDIYSLGVLLYEALAGSTPGRRQATTGPPLDRINPQVSAGLSDIIGRCLRSDPRDRYASAAALAGDLRRHLNHLPLVGVPNRSLIERWRKWRLRRPSALPRQVSLALAAAGLIALAVLLVGARGLLVAPIPGRPAPELDQRTRTDLLDIITTWADLRVRLAPAGDVVDARKEALARLDQAAAILGSGPAVERLRVAYGKALDRSAPPGRTPASLPAPRTAWEYCDLGRAFLRDGEYACAAEHFQQAVDLRPRDFWPNFYLGLCAYKLGRYEDALDAFRVCISLADNPAECYYNRALAYEALGRNDEALRDYTRALECDDRLTGAALNRGILYYASGRYADAAVDLSRALATASGRQPRAIIHYNRALVELARGHRPAAVADLKAAKDYGHAQAHELHDQLEAARGVGAESSSGNRNYTDPIRHGPRGLADEKLRSRQRSTSSILDEIPPDRKRGRYRGRSE